MSRVRKELIQLLRRMQAESTLLSNNRQLLSLPMMKLIVRPMPTGEKQFNKINLGELNRISVSNSNMLNLSSRDRICHSQLMKIFKKEFLDKIISRECNNSKFGDRMKTSLPL